MPVITFDGSFLSLEKKERIIKEFTELACEITNIPKEAFVIFSTKWFKYHLKVGAVFVFDLLW